MEPDSEFLEFLARGEGLAVAANSRASRGLRRAYANWRVANGAEAWNSPSIFDWNGWLTTLWNDYLFTAPSPPLLLSHLQEHWLWKRLLKTRPEAAAVLSQDALASMAQQAYSLLSDYVAPRSTNWTTRGDEPVNDAEAFRKWAVLFDAECVKKRLISSSRLASLLTDAVQTRLLQPPAKVRLVGFDRLTPAQDDLLDAMRNAGSDITVLDLHRTSVSRRLVLAPSRNNEIAVCAAWVRRKLIANPHQRIAIIVTDVAAVRGEIDRTFRRILSPESLDIHAKPASLPFEFSLGVPLSSVPVVRAALILLRWLKGPLTAEETSWLLLSGFVALTDTETLEFASIDSRIRSSGLMQQQVSLPGFLTQFRKQRRNSISQLAERLATMQSSIPRRARRGPLEWTELTQNLLQTSGWPGPAEIDSVEFQARQKWTLALESMATLGFDGGEIDFKEFLTTLARHVEETIFAPESRDAQVQILGPAESSGQTFDAIWFMGVDESSWPIFGRPHPMIPAVVQQNLKMPHSSSLSDVEFAGIVTKRIVDSASELAFSYSRQNKDGVLRPSPLLQDIEGLSPLQTSESLIEELGLEVERSPADYTEKTFDSDLIPWPDAQAAGGFTILKRQSACAFQSFAQKRLASGELDRAGWGLSPLQRGDLLHQVMEQLWSVEPGSPSQLHSSEELRSAIHENRLGELVTLHVESVFASHRATQAVDDWSRAYLAGERKRLHSLVIEWLMFESLRVPFQVEAIEKKLANVKVGDLRLNLRVDRVDQLADGDRLLVDYKTGQVASSMWRSPRMAEPQLPLYATYGGLGDIPGILFAQTRAGSLKFIGRVRDARAQIFSTLSGSSQLVKEPMEESILEQWTDDLLTLANDFLHGEASVNPKQYPETCKFCNLPSLCRVKETNVPMIDSDSTQKEEAAEPEQAHD